MIDINDGTFFLAILSLVIPALFLLVGQIYFSRNEKTFDIGNNKILPPMCKCEGGRKEIRKNLMSKRAPQFLLSLAREMAENISAFCLFQLPATLGGISVYTASDYRSARAVLDNPNSTKPFLPYKAADMITGGVSLFSANGYRHRHVRKSTSPAFAPQNIRLMTKSINKILEKWIVNRLEPLYIEKKLPIDFSVEMVILTIDVISDVAFDYNLADEEKMKLKVHLEDAQIEFNQKSKLNPVRQIPIINWIFFPGVRSAQRGVKVIRSICQHMLVEYRKKPIDQRKPHMVIDMIINNTEYASDKERVSDMILYFLAGFDTTAYTLSWALLELAKNPTEQIKLRKALKSLPTLEEALHCPELKRVTRETLRLHPAAALSSMRTVGTDIFIPVGEKGTGSNKELLLPKGSSFLISPFVIQRNKAIFGDNADEFSPDRWIDPTEEQLKSFLPFACGKRNCQGQGLASAELHLIIATLLSSYQLSVVDPGRGENFVIWKNVGSLIDVQHIDK